MTLNQGMRLEPSLALSFELQQELKIKWNKRVVDPFGFTPSSEKARGVTLEEAQRQNKDLGNFAAGSVRELLKRTNTANKERNHSGQKMVVAVGSGQQYDSQFVAEAAEACLKTVWIDVSNIACGGALKSVFEQYYKFGLHRELEAERLTPRVIEGEIQSVLAEPELHNLDLGSVELFYMCRVLGCLSEDSAPVVLQQMGQVLTNDPDSAGTSSILIVSALLEDNPDHVAVTSKLYNAKMIAQNIAIGAKHPVSTEVMGHHMYFTQKYSALIIQACG